MRRLLATGLVLPRSSIPGERYDTALRKNFTPLLPNPVGKTITAVVFFFCNGRKINLFKLPTPHIYKQCSGSYTSQRSQKLVIHGGVLFFYRHLQRF